MIPVALLIGAVVVMARELRAARAAERNLAVFAEMAQREQEARRERGDAIAAAIAANGAADRRLRLLLEAHRLASLANDCGARWVKTTTPAVLNHPDQGPALEMMSAISSTAELTRKGATEEGSNYGRTT